MQMQVDARRRTHCPAFSQIKSFDFLFSVKFLTIGKKMMHREKEFESQRNMADQ